MCLDVCVGRMVAGAGMLECLRLVWLQEGVRVVTRRQSGMGMEDILMFDV
jgi:hypothetical protein